MPSRLDAVQLQARHPEALASFWAELLGWEVDAGTTVDVAGREEARFRLRILPVSDERSGPNKIHLHPTSTSEADQQSVIDRALALGGRHLDVGQLPEEGHVVLADPDGNQFRVALA